MFAAPYLLIRLNPDLTSLIYCNLCVRIINLLCNGEIENPTKIFQCQ